MISTRKFVIFVGVLLLCIQFFSAQGIAPKIKIPPVFQVEVKGIFKDVKKEMVGTLFYDSPNNRGAFYFTHQGVTTQYIYRFDDGELLQISGTNCTVTGTRKGSDTSNIFFPFSAELNGKTILAKPDDVLFFTNSTFDSDGSAFPSYIYKAKLNLDGSKCEVTHVFTKPEMKVPECDSNICEPVLASMNIACLNNDGSLKADKSYDFFRFSSSIVDTNVFLPPSGVFCNVRNKNKFPGLPSYFSFTYDVSDERKGTLLTSDGLTVHKKVWYDTNLNVLRVDEFDTEKVQIASRIFDISGGVVYTSRTTLPACEIASINSKDVPLNELTKLPKVFFQEQNILSKALLVGTRRVNGLDYEIWSLLADDKHTSAKIVQEFYFKKDEPKSGTSENLRLSRAELYTYQINKKPMFSSLPVNTFIDRLRWEAFDVTPCFTNDQKKEFRLKVDGPATEKDSKIFQEVLNQLYIKLVQATNISAVRFSDLACVHDGVRIIYFTGKIMDKPKVISSDPGKYQLDMTEVYRVLDYLSSNGKLSLKLSKGGQPVEYKITGMEEIKYEEEDKNLYSGGVVVACVFGCTPLAIFVGAFISINIRKRQVGNDSTESENGEMEFSRSRNDYTENEKWNENDSVESENDSTVIEKDSIESESYSIGSENYSIDDENDSLGNASDSTGSKNDSTGGENYSMGFVQLIPIKG